MPLPRRPAATSRALLPGARKVAGKTVTRRLTPRQAQLYEQWIANRRHLDEIITAMEDVSREAAEQLLDDTTPT
ncbi:MAG: hypothetical protein KY462_04090 [Actinobacteria bacterium]|nr:hypothetical protein [Actinomycetota bacterium]